VTDPKPRYQRHPRRATYLTIALVVTVFAAMWLGYAANAAARDHRAAVEAMYLDYTGMAVREFSRLSGESVHWFLDEVFDLRRGRRFALREVGIPEEEIGEALDWHDCACPSLRMPIAGFRVDEAKGLVEVVPEILGPDARGWLLGRLATRAEGSQGVILGGAGSPFSGEISIWYAARSRSSDQVVEGFIAPAGAVGELIGHWYENNALLPPSTRRNLPDDSLLHVRVTAADGSVLFASSQDPFGSTASYDTVGAESGGLGVAVDIRPIGAQAFAAGGMPPPRTPLFLSMLMLVVLVGVGGLVQLRREVELARLRDDFVSGASHELRTPLAQIRLFAELQRSGTLRTEEQRQRAVDVIDREARRLTHLLENVLHFNEPAAAVIARRTTSVGDVIDDVAEGLGLLIDSKGSGLRRDVEPGLWVSMTDDSLKRILSNLLDNALKYGPRGQTLVVTAARTPRGILIGVEDEGPGVPAADRDLIWQRYRRLDRDIRGPEPGTGVGLAVVADLARENGGDAWVEESPAGGARFVVLFPAAEYTAEAG